MTAMTSVLLTTKEVITTILKVISVILTTEEEITASLMLS